MADPLTPDSIKNVVKQHLDQAVDVPEGHKGALVTVVNTDKVDVALATKVNQHWTVNIIGSHEWTGDSQIGVINKITW